MKTMKASLNEQLKLFEKQQEKHSAQLREMLQDLLKTRKDDKQAAAVRQGAIMREREKAFEDLKLKFPSLIYKLKVSLSL